MTIATENTVSRAKQEIHERKLYRLKKENVNKLTLSLTTPFNCSRIFVALAHTVWFGEPITASFKCITSSYNSPSV